MKNSTRAKDENENVRINTRLTLSNHPSARSPDKVIEVENMKRRAMSFRFELRLDTQKALYLARCNKKLSATAGVNYRLYYNKN